MVRYMWEPMGGPGLFIKDRRSPSAISRIRSHPYNYTNATRHGEFREAERFREAVTAAPGRSV